MRNDVIVYESKLKNVTNKIELEIYKALEEAGGAVKSQVQQNQRVDTGKTKGSWKHHVSMKEHAVYIGSSYVNAIYEEFGTGIHAIDENGMPSGKGRQTPWVYTPDDGSTFYRTRGKKPIRPLYNAMKLLRPKIAKYFKERFKNL